MSTVPPPSATCLHFFRAYGSAFTLLIDFDRLFCVTTHSLSFLALLGFGKQRPHHPGMGTRLGVLPNVGLLGGVVFERVQRQARVRIEGQRCQSLGSLDQ